MPRGRPHSGSGDLFSKSVSPQWALDARSSSNATSSFANSISATDCACSQLANLCAQKSPESLRSTQKAFTPIEPPSKHTTLRQDLSCGVYSTPLTLLFSGLLLWSKRPSNLFSPWNWYCILVTLTLPGKSISECCRKKFGDLEGFYCPLFCSSNGHSGPSDESV